MLCGEAGDACARPDRAGRRGAGDGAGASNRRGSGGVRLSGGQAQRLALARTLAHPRPVLVLDDPFSALDRRTEDEVFARLSGLRAQDRVVILISHRLYHFPELRQIVFMQGGKADVGTHEALLCVRSAYRALYESQTGGAAHRSVIRCLPPSAAAAAHRLAQRGHAALCGGVGAGLPAAAAAAGRASSTA